MRAYRKWLLAVLVCVAIFALAIFLIIQLDHVRNRQRVQQALNEQCTQSKIVESDGTYSYDPTLNWTNGKVTCSLVADGREILCSCAPH
jgi:hypothetical protein